MKASELKEKLLTQQIRESLRQFREKARNKQLLDLFNHCALCGQELYFHYSNSNHGVVTEKACCPKCEIEAPKRDFRCH